MQRIVNLEIFKAIYLRVEVFLYCSDNVLAKHPLKNFFVSKNSIVSFFPKSPPEMGKSDFPQESNITLLRWAIPTLKIVFNVVVMDPCNILVVEDNAPKIFTISTIKNR